MSRFNPRAGVPSATNMEGADAFRQSTDMQLISLLLTSFGGDSYYETHDATAARLAPLLKADPKFSAQAVLYARKVFGMRSITHVAGSLLAEHVSGQPWATAFYRELVHRPDDMLEIRAYHEKRGQKLSAAMKRGFGQAFSKFDGYSLAKYRGEGKEISLVDMVNMVRPIPVERNAEALKQLVNGELRAEDTWETMLTRAGQQAKDADEKKAAKAAAWSKLLEEDRLGYFALLKNLRNIIEQAPAALPKALQVLQNEKRIGKALVLPFRYSTAYRELMQLHGPEARTAAKALSNAADIALRNVPKLEGNTLVALDISTSMSGRPSEIGALFAAVLVKGLNADLIKFAGEAHAEQVDTGNSTLSIAESIRFSGGATNFHSIFRAAGMIKYDRIVILSDMQAWMHSTGMAQGEQHGTSVPTRELGWYRQRTGADPTIYSFDLKGYGTLQFPERKVLCLAGFNEKVFEVMGALEKDPHALTNAAREAYPLA